MTLTAATATFQAQYNLPYTFRDVFIDSDNNPARGYAVTVDGQIGADYLIENGTFYSYVGPGFTWAPISDVNPLVSNTGGLYTWQVPTNRLGTSVSTLSVVFEGSGRFDAAHTDVITAALG